MAETSPWLVVGLGNPGSKYANHRHNVGFMVVQRWLDLHAEPGTGDWREKFHGRFATVCGEFGRAVVLQPQTYMNLSGKSVAAAATFHRVALDRIIVVHDEVDFAFGRVAVKRGGGHGGHNGLRDIVASLGNKGDFLRVRVGVGRPAHGDVSPWVLSDFSGVDAAELPDLVDRAQQAVTSIMTHGLAAAMNEFNQKPPASERSP
jgi:PTH1 family peptidyl-tRNA hydrolase